ncbi:unnamed protein product [Cylicostephanus goldi]|uniref:Uncharacterized protein n=1 Tax=Cylicostephanus goldi TaxID=71465 RepID=A0A3P7QM01_CYLGO|nr:unnamed protein product [Cylicostephanus goldi]
MLVLVYNLTITIPFRAPFVVLPPSLRINALNTIIVSPVKIDSENADIHLSVLGYKDKKSSIIFTQKLKAKRAGEFYFFEC